MLLSFAQFEREIAGERIRDKIAASKKKGMWMGGNVPLGYDVKDRKLIINEPEAATVNGRATETWLLRPQFMRPRRSHRSKSYALRSGTLNVSIGICFARCTRMRNGSGNGRTDHLGAFPLRAYSR
jgi:hypothetical protein